MLLLREFTKDQLQVRIFDTRKAMGDCAGQEIAQCLRELLSQKETVNVMFAAAPSQHETLTALIEAKGIDWTRINAFHMDEYVDISPSHGASFCNFLNRAIFTKKPFASVNLINASAPDKDVEAKRYTALLESHKLDVCILGIGENGHIAFNDPSVANFIDPKGVKIVKLEEICRMKQVHDKCFNSLEEVPLYAYTVTIPALLKASHMFCSAPSATKAQAAKAMLDGPISESCPASVLRRHSDARLYLDKDSGALVL